MRSNIDGATLVAGDFDEIQEERGIQKRKALSDITKSILAFKVYQYDRNNPCFLPG